MTTMRPFRRRRAVRGVHTQRVDAAQFPALRALVRGYLHEDHAAEYGSARAAIAAFARDAPPPERLAAAREWRRFAALTGDWSLGELRRALTDDLGGAWHPATRRDIERAFAGLGPALR